MSSPVQSSHHRSASAAVLCASIFCVLACGSSQAAAGAKAGGEPAQTENEAAVPITNGNQGAYAPAPGYQPAPPGQPQQYQSPQYQAPQYQAQPQQSYQPPPAASAPIQVEPLK